MEDYEVNSLTQIFVSNWVFCNIIFPISRNVLIFIHDECFAIHTHDIIYLYFEHINNNQKSAVCTQILVNHQIGRCNQDIQQKNYSVTANRSFIAIPCPVLPIYYCYMFCIMFTLTGGITRSLGQGRHFVCLLGFNTSACIHFLTGEMKFVGQFFQKNIGLQ